MLWNYNSYGFVLAVVFPTIVLSVSVAIFIKRDNPFVRCRNPLFLIVQNIGAVASSQIFFLYIYLRPHFVCEVYYVGYVFSFSIVAIALLFRCWEYCINYQITQLKAQFRSIFFEVEKMQHYWVYKYIWIKSPRFLNKLFLLCIFFLTGFLIGVNPSAAVMDGPSQACLFNMGFTATFAIGACIIFVSSLIIGTLVRHSVDVCRMKLEIIILALVWTVSLVGSFLSNAFDPVFVRLVAPSVVFGLFGQIATFFTSNLLALGCAFAFEKSSGGKEASLENFVAYMESANFRNSFHEFLTKQFCQENLQFYEVVHEWKSLKLGDTMKSEKAKMIVKNYVEEGSVCQVHVEDEVSRAIIEYVNGDSIPDNVFDEAVETLVNDMQVNSFKLFVTTPLYKSLLQT